MNTGSANRAAPASSRARSAGVCPDNGGFEQLAHNSEPEPALEFPTARGEHSYPQRASTPAELVEQHGLPNAGRALDQQDAAGARDRIRPGRRRARARSSSRSKSKRLLAEGKDFGRHFGRQLCCDAAVRTGSSPHESTSVVNAAVNSAASASHYPFDNAAPQAGDRFASLAKLYDGVTRRHLDRFGIGAGQHCLEVGAGGGSVARFMSERVGPAGHVVATDINTDWMSGSQPGNVELRRHDIGVDPLPERAFDIVHARAVLTFVPERRSALMRMIARAEARGLAAGRGDGAAGHRGVGSVRRTRHRDCAERPSRNGRAHSPPRWRSGLRAGACGTCEGRRAHRSRCGGLLRPVSHRRSRWARQGEYRPTRRRDGGGGVDERRGTRSLPLSSSNVPTVFIPHLWR